MKIAAKLESETSKHHLTPREVSPTDKLLGDMLLALDQPKDTLVAYEENLKGHPNRFNGLYGAAIAVKKSGNRKKTLYYKQLMKLTKNSKRNRPELNKAKTYINQDI
jgi:hypothetical protein